jgi:hypothetical protein
VCELQIEAKKKGIKGYSGLKKAQLEQLVKTGAKPAKPAKKEPPSEAFTIKVKKKKEKKEPAPKKEPPSEAFTIKVKKKKEKKEPAPKKEPIKLLTYKEVNKEIYKDKSYKYLKKLYDKVLALTKDTKATEAERERAKTKLKPLEQAMNEAKKKTYGKKK